MLRLFALAAVVAIAHGHGAMVHPRSRNSIDWEEVPNDPSKGIHNTGEYTHTQTLISRS